MFPIGSHILVQRSAYTHHGIYIGDDKVIHYSGFHTIGNKGAISLTTLKSFCDGGKPEIYPFSSTLRGKLHSPDSVVERAKSRLGENSYNLIFNNCEHFCNWCTHGDEFSMQTAGGVERNVRQGYVAIAGGSFNLFDLIAPFKNLLK